MDAMLSQMHLPDLLQLREIAREALLTQMALKMYLRDQLP
jgi:hypothetical protein